VPAPPHVPGCPFMFSWWGSREKIARDAVIVLLAKLAEGRVFDLNEKKLQKLVFLALYVKEDGERFEDEELRSIIDDYMVAWFGVYSGKLRDILEELRKEGLIEWYDEGLVIPTRKLLEEARSAEKRLKNKASRVLEKIIYIIGKYGEMSALDLERLTDEIIGISGDDGGAVKALMLGAKINDLIEAAKVYSEHAATV